MKRPTANALREEIHSVINARPFLTKLERGDYTVTLPRDWTWKGLIAAARANGSLDRLPLLRKVAAVYHEE